MRKYNNKHIKIEGIQTIN